MPTLEEQIKLEHEMVSAGIDRYLRDVEKHQARNTESMTKAGRTLVASTVLKVSEGIEEMLQTPSNNRNIAKKKLTGMDTKTVAYIALSTVVDLISAGQTLLKTARAVGLRVETQYRLDLWIEKQGKVAERMINKAQEKSDGAFAHKQGGLDYQMRKQAIGGEWTKEERIHVGLRLIDLIIIHTGMFEINYDRKRGKTTAYMISTPQTLEWIKGFNETYSAHLPRYAPSIIPPKPWTSVRGGGYHSEVIKPLDFMRVKT